MSKTTMGTKLPRKLADKMELVGDFRNHGFLLTPKG